MCPISIYGALLLYYSSRWPPNLYSWCPMAPRKRSPDTHVWVKPSHSQRMWAEVSSFAPHLLHNGLSESPIRWRCLFRVLCPVRKPVTALDWVLLKDRNLALARTCLTMDRERLQGSFSQMDVRTLLKFQVLLGKNALECYKSLNEGLGTQSPSHKAVRRWVNTIKNIRQKETDNAPCSGAQHW